ncbi:hypothetical protein [Streptomyces sp. NPDC046939]|uniref:hypothetical protein n=1 Tax=Streptomyces sp. NPDC046939 TaxID=3155376 RepID=UPI0034022E52
MGFSGHLVFARSARPLREAPLFADVDAGLGDEAREWPPRPGGWQTLQLEHGIWADEYLPALVEWSGAPACVADVSDSSLALVTGLDTGGQRWQAWLHLVNAAALLVEEPEDVDDSSLWACSPAFERALRRQRAELDAEVPADAEGARTWALAAGVRPAPQSRIEELLRSEEIFVEELFDVLVDALGFPASDRCVGRS